jgi:CDP-glycerol glycerophosphotransferase (TagB/SpsB family)
MKSSFYQGLSSFVEQVSKSGMLEASGYEMHVKLHPNFMGYKDLFEFDDPRISLAGDVIDPSDYDIAITDFSSYVYDFIYAGSRVMYFLPDHVEFKAGLNQYSSLDLPYDEAFGPYCEDAETACATLGKLLDGSLPEEQARLYERRSNELFLHTDARNRDRLYAALKDLADKR